MTAPTLSAIASVLDKLAWTWLPVSKHRHMALKVAAIVLRRRVETVGDEVCIRCGCAELDPCGDELLGFCGWAEKGVCTHCAGHEGTAR